MQPFIRHCVECKKCLTRYVIGFSPYGNGSYLVRDRGRPTEEYILYCSCANPFAPSQWREEEIEVYAVSKAAHRRGYGSNKEVVSKSRKAGSLNRVISRCLAR
jgi:hypothetical protein